MDNALIFVTAYGSFENSIRAIRYSCLDFITKPIDYKELTNALDKALKQPVAQQQDTSSIATLLEIFKTDITSPKKIGLPLSQGVIQYEDCDNIVFILADDTISHIQLLDKQRLSSVKNLG